MNGTYAASSRAMRAVVLYASVLFGCALTVGCTQPPNDSEGESEQTALDPWAKSYNFGVYGNSIAAGPEGDVVIGGTFDETADFGGGMLAGDEGRAVFLAHLDAAGEHLMSGSTGSNDQVKATAVADSGAFYIAGSYDGAINFGGGKLTGYQNGYFAAFDKGGASDFSFAVGTDTQDSIDSVTVTPNGNIVIAGRAGSDADFGAGPQDTGTLTKQGVIAAYTRSGEHLWEIRMPYADTVELKVTSDNVGNVIVTGGTYSTIQFGNMTVDAGAFVGKISSTGLPLWIVATESPDYYVLPYFRDVQVAPNGDVLILGYYYYGQCNMGDIKSPFIDDSQPFVIRLSATGKPVGMQMFDVPLYGGPPSFALTPDGEMLMAFNAYLSADLGGGLIGTGIDSNVLLARFSPEGNHIKSMELKGDRNETVMDIASDADGNMLIIGQFDGKVEFSGKKLDSQYTNATYVGRIDLAPE
ncbi:MAG: hypothetical protein IPK82_11680 [Polyangiaceae bacterium]|nr:hypothetical protein [Polyangiaceae bacterium]